MHPLPSGQRPDARGRSSCSRRASARPSSSPTSRRSAPPCRSPRSAASGRPARAPSSRSSRASATRSQTAPRAPDESEGVSMSNPTTPIHRAPLSQQHRRVITTTSPDAIGAQVSVTIDGVEAKVPFGVTILEAAKNAGVTIPTLCDHPDLDVAGVCRMCVVEVEGQRTLQPACTFPVVNAMKVKTHSRKVRMARKHVLELLLSEHCGECYSCVRNGNCELQSLAEEYGITEFPFGHPEEPLFEPDTSSYTVMRDMNKCIRCRRCIRTCIDIQEVGVLEAVGRSNKVTIETFEDMPLGSVVCINCGQCVNRCPVGALYAKDETDAVWAAHRRPRQARRHPDGPRAALGHGRAVRPRAGHAGHVRDEHGPAPRRLRQGVRHQLHRRPHHHRGGHGAHPAPVQGPGGEGREHRPAAVHQLLAGLGQVPRALLPRVPAQRLERQEPAADVRRAHQDLLRREARPRPREDRERARSCPARPRSSSATGPRCTTPASRTSTTASPRASSARCSRRPASTCRACPRATSTTRSAPPPAPASSSAPPAA